MNKPSTAATAATTVAASASTTLVAAALAALLASPAIADAAELSAPLRSLATCESSWYESRRDEGRMRQFGEALNAQFQLDEKRRVWLPKGSVTWLGREISELTPQSVGMGLGFGVTLKAALTDVRGDFERAVGRSLDGCSSGDGMVACELKLADKKTAMMVGPSSKPERGTLLGCYYFYEQ